MKSPTVFPLSGRRVFVAGHRGMVGSALIRRLAQEECRILTVGRHAVDLRDQAAVELGQNSVGGFGPDKGFGAGIVLGEISIDGGLSGRRSSGTGGGGCAA